MAKLLILNPKLYNQGAVPLFRGDRWIIDAKVVDRVGNVDTDYDLTASSVTGFFPAQDVSLHPDGFVSVSGTIVDAMCGKVRFTLLESATTGVQVNQSGIACFATISNTGDGLFTAPTPDFPVEVADRGFQET